MVVDVTREAEVFLSTWSSCYEGNGAADVRYESRDPGYLPLTVSITLHR